MEVQRTSGAVNVFDVVSLVKRSEYGLSPVWRLPHPASCAAVLARWQFLPVARLALNRLIAGIA